ncbi:hypothetical protein CTheo_4508 [Ceratobasidium theobromae]|uniref:Uncharacterized protein n=1 Tax=Ceratobasidium theobromae TaxID=1582974 RepID=A0A5N5QLK2_9AGAM|nr:hypothetical protein CTheo_4508 [Ceratobasidium theobromae]
MTPSSTSSSANTSSIFGYANNSTSRDLDVEVDLSREHVIKLSLTLPVGLPPNKERTQPTSVLRARPRLNALADKTNRGSVPIATSTPKKPATPQAKPTVTHKPIMVPSADHNLDRSGCMTRKPAIPRETNVKASVDSYSALTNSRSHFDTSSPNYGFSTPHPHHGTISAGTNGVSGFWELCVTHYTFPISGTPWSVASPKPIGHMNAQLFDDEYWLADFALLGMDGMLKSRKCSWRADGMRVSVSFVAQILLTDGRNERNVILGPSEIQRVSLKFDGYGKVDGILKRGKHWLVEFTGERRGTPRDMVSNWGDFED